MAAKTLEKMISCSTPVIRKILGRGWFHDFDNAYCASESLKTPDDFCFEHVRTAFEDFLLFQKSTNCFKNNLVVEVILRDSTTRLYEDFYKPL